ncbi:MAG: hypothetical protein ACREAB_20985 [Blastocatellia bacterium]
MNRRFRRRRNRAPFHETSLVPMADMLTNTVGVMVFILIFTVLTAGGVVIAKRLPLERSVEAEPLHFFCAGDRVSPLDNNLVSEFMKPLGRPGSFYAVEGWLTRFNARRVEDEYFALTGDGESRYTDLGFGRSVSLDLTVICAPKEGSGETPADLKLATSRFRQLLKQHRPSERFIHLFVRPDSLEAFSAARAVAAETGFNTGWRPLNATDPAKFTLTGNGRTAMAQ